jgi:regulator of protease activity HflC (stomatin/prohibitin superfamily)
MNDSIIFILSMIATAIIFIFLAIRFVEQGMEYTVERFGKYTHTLKPGMNFIIPFMDSVGKKISTKESVMDIQPQEVITGDNAMVKVDGVVFYQVIDAAKAAYQVDNLHGAIENITMTNIRTVMGSMELDGLLSRRDDINNRLLAVVDQATEAWGVKVLRIEIKDITPPKDLVDSMARQMKAERDKRAMILEAQGKREAEVQQAEGVKRAMILAAEGRKESAIMDAEARERLAQAEANATRMMSQSIAEGNIQAVNYFIALKYVEALQKIASADNQKVIMMPLDASSLMGTISGISELAQEALNQRKSKGTH